ncbi:MAG: FHA domain-containing protein, partial [Chloroflexi bacterium]|nr:FHA domain-containing protein [Chloroflexota bacterium]
PPFLVRTGDPSRTEHPIRRTLVLGRGADAGIVVSDPRVSRRHAEVAQVEGREYVLRDLHSANGTLLNGRPVAGERTLHQGDTINLGGTSFVYHNEFEIARPRLLRADGTRRTVHPLGSGLVLGRLPDNDVLVADSQVSRRHAAVRAHDGVVYVRDLNSLNGTRVNGVLVIGDRPLRDGDVITLGKASFTYHNDFDAVNPN